MASNSIPPKKTHSDESINRGLVCAHMHFIARTQKILTFMSETGECRQQKHTQHAPSTKTECDYLNGWIKKRSHTQKSHPKVVNPRDIAGERKKKKKKSFSFFHQIQLAHLRTSIKPDKFTSPTQSPFNSRCLVSCKTLVLFVCYLCRIRNVKMPKYSREKMETQM